MQAPRETIRADTYLQRVRPRGRAAAEQITLAGLRDRVGTLRKPDFGLDAGAPEGFLRAGAAAGFAFATVRGRLLPFKKLLAGRSVRIIVTMGMPGWVYRWYFRAHSPKTLKRNILASCGLKPVRASVVGAVETMSRASRGNWLAKVQKLGAMAR